MCFCMYPYVRVWVLRAVDISFLKVYFLWNTCCFPATECADIRSDCDYYMKNNRCQEHWTKRDCIKTCWECVVSQTRKPEKYETTTTTTSTSAASMKESFILVKRMSLQYYSKIFNKLVCTGIKCEYTIQNVEDLKTIICAKYVVEIYTKRSSFKI